MIMEEGSKWEFEWTTWDHCLLSVIKFSSDAVGTQAAGTLSSHQSSKLHGIKHELETANQMH